MLSLAIPRNAKTDRFLDFLFLNPVIVKKRSQLLLQWEEPMKFTVLFKKVNSLKCIFILFIQTMKLLTARAKFL